MIIGLTEKGRELGLSTFKQALHCFEHFNNDRKTLTEIRKNIHKEFKKEAQYMKKNGVFDEKGIKYNDLTDQKIEKTVESLKFLCLHIISIVENNGGTKTQDVLDFLNEKIEIFSKPF